jgi:glycosyltransferase involved in cell wall biosynthesis
MMRIAVDARELAGKPTGVGRYLTQILSAWGEMGGAASHEFILCAGDPVQLPPSLRATVIRASGSGTIWEQLVLPRLVAKARPDVLFAPGYTAPMLASVPMVVTIHDVSFAARPEWFGWREGARRRALTRWSARRASRVITVSDFSKREIVKHLGIDQSKIEVIYSGATMLPYTRLAADAQNGHVVLYVGSLFNRRRLPELLLGFDRLAQKHPGVRLEIVGDNRTRPHVDFAELIGRLPSAPRIRARSYVGDEELAALYRSASAFAFLSDYEGFAMTPLEALAAGIPVVLLDTAIAREIYGPAAIYVSEPEPGAIAAALESALFDKRERERTLDAASVQLERYSWHECAQRTLQVLLACTHSA